MSNFNSKKYLHKESVTSPWFMIPFILTLTVLPFVLGLYNFDSGLSNEYWQSTTTASTTDIFLHYKSNALAIAGGILAIIFVTYRFMKKRKFSFGIAMIPVYVYIGCIILSTIFSTNKQFSLHGIQHHFEPMFVLLAYCMLVMYGAYFVDNDRTVRWFINGFLIGSALFALFGLFQYSSGIVASLYDNKVLSTRSDFYIFMSKLFGTGTDMPWYEKLEPFKTDWMAKYLYLPTGQPANTLSLNFPLGQVFLTVYNPNYVAYFTTLTAPFFAGLCLFQEKLWRKIVFALVAVASILCLLGSRSVAGFLSLGISFLILIVAFRKKIFKHWKIWLCALGVFIIALFGFNMLGNHAVSQRFNYIMGKIKSGAKKGYGNEDTVGLRGLTSSKDGIRIEYRDSVVFFSMGYDNQNGLSCQFTDENGDILETQNITNANGESVITLKDKKLKGAINVTYSDSISGIINIPICCLTIDDKTWPVTNQIHTSSYSYVDDPNAPFIVMGTHTHKKIGTYYNYRSYPAESLQQFFQSFIDSPDSLKACMNQLATISPEYAEISTAIFSSEDPLNTAVEYFNQILSDGDAIYTFLFYLTQSSPIDENYYVYNQTGCWTQIGNLPKTALFTDYPGLASGRGFIWSRSIPLMFENAHSFLLGTGPDTFALDFPHYDYVNAYRCGYDGMFVTKPHSLYLQIGVQTGFISLLALLALYLLYAVATVKLYWKSTFETLTSKVSVAIFASISGYMISGITNDSTVTYSYVFWGMIGVGIAANRLEKRYLQEHVSDREHIEQNRLEREANKQKKQENE